MADIKNVNAEKAEAKKKGFGTKFMNFLAYGGFFVIIIGGLGLFILISVLTK